MSAVRLALALAGKDLRLQWRGRDVAVVMLVFSLLIVAVFSISLDLAADTAPEIVPGLLWITVLLAGLLGINHTLGWEKDKGTLDALLLCPVEREVLFVGKALSNFALMLLVLAVSVPAWTLLSGLPLFSLEMLVISLLTLLGLSLVGTLFAAVVTQGRSREALLPVLVLPAVLPVLIAAVNATYALLHGQSWPDIAVWLQLLAAFDLLFLAVAPLLFKHLIQE